MELTEATGGRSGGDTDGICVESFQFGEEIQRLMTIVPPPESGGSSFTALLELPPTQAMELLHSPESNEAPAGNPDDVCVEQPYQKSYLETFNCSPPTFPARLSTFAAARVGVLDGAGNGEESTETMNSVPSNSSKVKNEPADTDSNLNSSSPLISDPMVQNNNEKSVKRKEREKRVRRILGFLVVFNLI